MRRYHRIKNIIIALLASLFYCYSCLTVKGHDIGLIIFGTIGMFLSIGFLMFEFDSLLGIRSSGRRKAEQRKWSIRSNFTTQRRISTDVRFCFGRWNGFTWAMMHFIRNTDFVLIRGGFLDYTRLQERKHIRKGIKRRINNANKRSNCIFGK